MNIVHVFSGGMDSTTLLYKLRDEGHALYPISVNYGQRHSKELDAARHITQDLNLLAVHRFADLSSIAPLLQGSSLTQPKIEVPEGHYAAESMKATVVPNRNMLLLSLAAAYAISIEADAVSYAAHAGDHTIYPDCRPAFVKAISAVFEVCAWRTLQLLAPFLCSTKTDIVRIGEQLHVPWGKTWSCYKGLEVHCGRCGTCVERQEAFTEAGVVDPVNYEE
jgi:7-cyano-7-deazaguanine synthase